MLCCSQTRSLMLRQLRAGRWWGGAAVGREFFGGVGRACAGAETLKIHTFPYIFHDFSGGVESMGGPRIAENTTFSYMRS